MPENGVKGWGDLAPSSGVPGPRPSPNPTRSDFDEIVILLKLREEFTGLTVTQLSRFLAKKLYSKASKKEIQKKVHRILDKLEEKGLVKTKTIGNYRFAKITPEGLRFLAQTVGRVDLSN